MISRSTFCATILLLQTAAPLAAGPIYLTSARTSVTHSKSYRSEAGDGRIDEASTDVSDPKQFGGSPDFGTLLSDATTDDELASQKLSELNGVVSWEARASAAGERFVSTNFAFVNYTWGDATSTLQLTFELAEPTEFQVRWESFGDVITTFGGDQTYGKASLSITMGATSELSIVHAFAHLNHLATHSLVLPAGTHILSAKVESFANFYFGPQRETYSADVTGKLILTPVPEPSNMTLAGL